MEKDDGAPQSEGARPSPSHYTSQLVSCFHRITDSLMLEKTSKIMKSNRQPNTIMSAKPCPEVPYLHVFWTTPGMVTLPPTWAACSNIWPLFQ